MIEFHEEIIKHHEEMIDPNNYKNRTKLYNIMASSHSGMANRHNKLTLSQNGMAPSHSGMANCHSELTLSQNGMAPSHSGMANRHNELTLSQKGFKPTFPNEWIYMRKNKAHVEKYIGKIDKVFHELMAISFRELPYPLRLKRKDYI
jgi:hypothetical protein